ncbi:thymidylate synthase, flavin-dependent [Mycobacterium xenopi 4042]|uniref:FAD-dependent thymidylate synthase n=1 Tax=Mycobacterium xenopi 4042 TaxID=1299334 RepID=X8CGZ7_MYCXE|nr:thymidylate synthase, flavin-dependent [Mycobacterium xenopi 4042]
MIRHRHFSYSQLSQRYVPERDSQVVVPPGMEDDPELEQILTRAADASRATYTELLAKLETKFADQPNAVLRRKQARQAARAVLPNATETRIVVTGNYRAWRHFIAMRASEHADVEIRRLAIACLRQLIDIAPPSSPTSKSPPWPTAPRSPPVRSPPKRETPQTSRGEPPAAHKRARSRRSLGDGQVALGP